MKEKKRAVFFLVAIPAVVIFLLNAAPAAGKTAGSWRNGIHLSYKTYPSDSLVQKKKLFNELKELNQTRGIYFLFTDKSFGDILVSPVKDEAQPVEQILESLLQNTGLQYKKVNDKTFIILPQNTKTESVPAQGFQKDNTGVFPAGPESVPVANLNSTGCLVKGRVTSIDGSALAHVSVVIKGTSKGITTNSNGEFSIVSKKGDVLEFSFIGFMKKEIIIETEKANLNIITRLTALEATMDEVIVTSLGVKKSQKSLGYAVSTINAEELTASGNTNFASALYGKAGGVRITTAPGGATSAVQVQVRGLNSLNFNSQPLYVVDGIVIRNTNEKGIKGINNNGYWDDQRIRGNGILDINPSDIETLTILKGASATALYGSEAASGVVVITTKKGLHKPGMAVELNSTTNIEQVAFLPKYQNVYGPGFDRATNLANGATEDGWVPADLNGDGVFESLRPNFSAYAQFGPKMENQQVSWWDGKMHSYSARPNNYRDLYRKGYNSILNAAFSKQTEKNSFRFSYTRNDYKGIQVGGDLQRNTFNLNSSFKITPQLTADIVMSYINSKVHNRPFQLNRILASYSGYFSRAEDMGLMFDKYKTSQDYKWVPWNQQQRNPAEALTYDMKSETLDFLWNQLRNSTDENQGRLLSSLTLNYEFNKNLHIRGRFGNDYTSLNTETRNYNEYPVAFNGSNSTGSYQTGLGRYTIFYGDVLLTYAKKINKNLEWSFSGGYQGRNENYNDLNTATNGGLLKENWFSLNNSFGTITSNTVRTAILKYAYLGFITMGYKNFWFLEATARQEYSSTLPPGYNSYFYPSINSGLVFSEKIKLPSFINYGKLRASYGIVGNAPPAYASGITFMQTTIPTFNGPVAALSPQVNAGNNSIRPENKHEIEFGLELKMLKNRIGMDITYYNSNTINQIVQLTVPASSGALTRLVNAGTLQSNGMELALNIIMVQKKKFYWIARMNFASGNTRVVRLDGSVKEIVYYQGEQNALKIVAESGRKVGNIYVYSRLKDGSGNDVIGNDGLYVMDNTRYELAGNVMPKITGGLANTFSWKNLSLNFMIDYRLGGQLVSPALKYNIGAGMYESTLQYRDASHGGLAYYINSGGEKILASAGGAPAGAKIYNDGIVLKGANLNGKENTSIVDAATYYMNMFGWGAAALNKEGTVYNNSYAKMREAVLAFNLSEQWAKKIHCKVLRVSLIGRNLFYLFRTLKNLDPEAPIGSSWSRQSIDEGSSAATRSYGIALNFGL